MTREEFAKITMTIKCAYQKETNLFANEQIVKLWYEHLKDLDYMALQVALSAWIDTNKWSPSIADLREMCTRICDGTPEDWSEAWEKVLYAISQYGRDKKSAAMDYFDEVTGTVVSRIGWYTLCASEDISIERANFRQIFQVVKRKYIESKQLHPAIRKVIEANQQSRRKMIESKPVEESGNVWQEKEPGEYSDRIQELINRTKRKLKG